VSREAAAVPATSLAGTFAVGLLYAAVYLKDWASIWIGTPVVIGVLGAGLLVGALSIFAGGGAAAPEVQQRSNRVLVLAMVLWAVSMAMQGRPLLSNYYLSVPCAWVAVNCNRDLFLKLLVAHLVATVLIEAYEYVSGSYLFIYVASDGTELDPNLFGGGQDVFRAKGLFQGPLSAVAFALWIAFLYRPRLAAIFGLFAVAFFASGRLGMLTSVVLLASRLVPGHGIAAGRALLIVPVVILAMVALVATVSEDRLAFIMSALDLENDQNVSRLEFWAVSLSHYLNYDVVEKLFGSYGFIQEEEGGTESDCLRLLLDCGILGLLMYLLAIGRLVLDSLRFRDRDGALVAGLIVVLMNVFPFVQSLSSTLLFWVYVFDAARERQAEADDAGAPEPRLVERTS
jgi:hypothetical protein